MKAIQMKETGGADVLRLADVEIPRPAKGEILVKLGAIGVNFIEIYQRIGRYSVPLPHTPGAEGAGVVTEIGEGVSGVSVGDRVTSTDFRGSYAQYSVVAADRAVPIPEGVSEEVAAAAMLQGMTAHYLATSTFPLAAGHRCLVFAAAGGVGLLLCQLAKKRGALVIGVVSSERKAAAARAAGADHIVFAGRDDLVAKVREMTFNRGVSVVYDSVGRDTFDHSLSCLEPRGMMVLFGQSSGPVPPVDPQLLNRKGSVFLTRPTLGHYIPTRDDLLQRAGDILGGIRDGTLKLTIDRRVPLADAAAAHTALESRQTSGKVVLIP